MDDISELASLRDTRRSPTQTVSTPAGKAVPTYDACHRDHPVIDISRAPVPDAKVQHIASGLRDGGYPYQAAGMRRAPGLSIVWEPSRHRAGHNHASAHFEPSGYYSDMDGRSPGPSNFEPRSWHGTLPLVPKVSSASGLSKRGTTFAFDLTSNPGNLNGAVNA